MQSPPLPAAATLNLFAQPIWAVQSDMAVDFGNAAAQEVTRTQAWVRRSNGHLVALGDLDIQSLANLVRHAAHGVSSSCDFGCRDGLSAPLRPARLSVMPVQSAPLYAEAWPRSVALLMVAVSVLDEQTWIKKHLARHLGLSNKECQVLEHLVGGQKTTTIAGALGISVVTVRTHLRALREKTGRRSQVELVRLALGR